MNSNALNLPKFELSPRKCCITCQKPLIASNGIYFHVEEPCAGLRDYVYIEATIEDVFLNEKFEKMYGKPEIDDYKRIELLEAENNGMSKQLLSSQEKIDELKNQVVIQEKKLGIPLIKFLLRLFH